MLDHRCVILALVAALSVSSVMAKGKADGKVAPASLKSVIVPQEVMPPPPSAGEAEDHAARHAIEHNSFYDPANPDLQHLQRLEEVTRGMPFDANGFPDWMRALREGSINPRTSLKGQGKMEVLDMDVIMRNTKEMPNVRFPHRPHTLWLDCSNCHPAPFKPVAGSNEIRMADIFRGNFCGMCHDRVAFITFFSCSRCHSVPQGSAAMGKSQ
jgi:c(7)-type cytochrome triheme protein